MSAERVPGSIDASALPSYAYSHRSLMWWGTLGLMLVEGTVFVLAVMAYFYLHSRTPIWPPSGVPPKLIWGTLNTVILLVSLWPNRIVQQAAVQQDLRRLRIALLWCLASSVLFLALRVMEFGALNVRWDTDAYGSAVWMLMGLHTVHLITDTYDTAVLATLFFTGPLEGRRYVDASENAVYWYFVVASWLPIYAVVYWAPRG